MQTQSHTTVYWQAFSPQLYIEHKAKYIDTCVPTKLPTCAPIEQLGIQHRLTGWRLILVITPQAASSDLLVLQLLITLSQCRALLRKKWNTRVFRNPYEDIRLTTVKAVIYPPHLIRVSFVNILIATSKKSISFIYKYIISFIGT